MRQGTRRILWFVALYAGGLGPYLALARLLRAIVVG